MRGVPYPVAIIALCMSLPACDILFPPDGELVLMVTTGQLDFLADTVKLQPGQQLHLHRYQLGMNRWQRQDKDQPPIEVDENGVVFAHYYERLPDIFSCVRGEPDPRDMYFWGNPPPCDHHVSAIQDSVMLLTPELREVAKQIMPCAEEINPENSRQQGAFRECATATYRRVEEGPGLISRGATPECTEVGCLRVEPGFCGWTWAGVVKLDGYKQRWPDPPFAGQDRIEVEVAC